MRHTTQDHLAGEYVSGEGQRCSRCGYLLTKPRQAERIAFALGAEITVRHYVNGERHCVPTRYSKYPAERCMEPPSKLTE